MRIPTLAALAAGVLATACADVPVTTGSFRGGANPMFTYAASGRDLRTEVVGNPFAIPKEQLDAAVLQAMQGRFRAQPTTLVSVPTPSTRSDSRLVLAFDPRPEESADSLCRASEPAATAAATDRLRAILAFCYRGIPYAETRGSVAKPNSPRDPAFDNLLGALAVELLPGADATMHDFIDNE